MPAREGSGMPAGTDSYRALVERVRELDGAVLSEHEAVPKASIRSNLVASRSARQSGW